VLIDDSIVRGTTCARIVKLLRDAGATEIHMMVTAPPFIAPCYYGTDVDSKDKLIACKLTHDEIVEKIGVDSLGFISLESTKKIACGEGCKGFCTACFDEKYPTAIPENVEKSKFDQKISKNGGNE
ncbi:MAG: amidophosphoribosyltransferase, partial [Clostridia bacterium]|nr:amidophosphoribosyltransferase [Clostridia bacterium]